MKPFNARRSAAVAALALAAGALVSSGPAQSATGLIDYSCTITGDYKFTFAFDQDTNAKAPLYAGKSYAHTYTAKTTFPEGGVNIARFFGVTSFDGAIDATVLRNGVPITVHAPIPKKNVSPSGTPLVLTATGPLPAVKLAGPGKIVYKPSDIKFTVRAFTADGGTLFSLNKGDCDMAPAGDSKVMDTLTFVKSPTAIAPAVGYNKTAKKATASATIARTSGVPALGKVTFTLFKGTTKLKTVVAGVAGNKATAAFLNVKAKGTYKVVMTYGGSSALNPSTAVRSFTVR